LTATDPALSSPRDADADQGARGDADGDGDGDERWPRGAKLAVACVVALALGLFLAASRDANDTSGAADPDPVLDPGATLPTDHPSLDDSDQYESFTLAQLESEVADESAPVALRLTLAERYLTTGDVAQAREQARLARAQAGTDVEVQRALRDLGWSLALLGRPERGAALLEESLTITPDERNATWYLANVRLSGLDDPAGAAELFRQLLDSDELSAEQRTAVEERLDAASSLAAP
jgi:tetratricopeptide (TPR) repeat protein